MTCTAGDIDTVAGTGTVGLSGDGGPATAARLADPESIAVDEGGNLLIADRANNRVREVAG
jgi:serine/threonine-protein kinase